MSYSLHPPVLCSLNTVFILIMLTVLSLRGEVLEQPRGNLSFCVASASPTRPHVGDVTE